MFSGQCKTTINKYLKINKHIFICLQSNGNIIILKI